MARRKYVPVSKKEFGTKAGGILKIRKSKSKQLKTVAHTKGVVIKFGLCLWLVQLVASSLIPLLTSVLMRALSCLKTETLYYKRALEKKITTNTTRRREIAVKSAYITPTLESSIQMPFIQGESTAIDAIAIISKYIMLMVTGTQELRSVNVRKNPKILCSYDLNDICRILKLDSNRAIAYYPSDHQRVDIFKVLPKLECTKSLHLDQGYDAVGVLKENLITVKYVDSYTTAFRVYNTDGELLRNFRPKLLNNIGLTKIRSLHVTPTNKVVVIDGMTSMVYVLPLDGELGFAYWGNDRYIHPIPSDVASKSFQTFCYRLESPVNSASDEDGNVYFGDRATGLIVKIDSEGNFVQNLLPLDGESMRKYYIKFLCEKGHLYVFDDEAVYGKVLVYKL